MDMRMLNLRLHQQNHSRPFAVTSAFCVPRKLRTECRELAAHLLKSRKFQLNAKLCNRCSDGGVGAGRAPHLHPARAPPQPGQTSETTNGTLWPRPERFSLSCEAVGLGDSVLRVAWCDEWRPAVISDSSWSSLARDPTAST
eukprot:6173886-Pleurochrysis_carterae.AAC.1